MEKKRKTISKPKDMPIETSHTEIKDKKGMTQMEQNKSKGCGTTTERCNTHIRGRADKEKQKTTLGYNDRI